MVSLRTCPVFVLDGNFSVLMHQDGVCSSPASSQPWSLPGSYVKFLNIHGGKGAAVVAALREMATEQKCSPVRRHMWGPVASHCSEVASADQQ